MASLEAVLDQDPNNVNLFSAGIKVGEVGAIQLQAHLRLHPQLTLLELKGSMLGRRGVEHLCQALRNHPGLRHLGLGRCQLDSHSASAVLVVMSTMGLHTLDLEWNSLGDPVAFALATYLRGPKATLLSVNLERNELRSEGASALAEALTVNTSLRNLNLAFNRIGGHACGAVRDMLKVNRTLLTLNLSMNAIYHDGAVLLAEGLCANKTLLSLSLQSNQALESFASLGAEMVWSPQLRELNFSLNRFPGNVGASFAEGLRSATGLVALSLAKCHVGEPGIAPVLEAIGYLPRLQTIDLSNVLMTERSAEGLSRLLVQCPNLCKVFLDGNRLGRIGADTIGNALHHCFNLTLLSLNGCDLGPRGVQSIALGLTSKRGLPLRTLRLQNNRMQNFGCVAVCAALSYALEEGEGSVEELDISEANSVTGECCQFLARVLHCNPKLSSVTVRGNQLADDVQASYLDLARALEFTAGVIGDPAAEQLALAAHETKSTFNVSKEVFQAPRANFNSTTDTVLGSLSMGPGHETAASFTEHMYSKEARLLSLREGSDTIVSAMAAGRNAGDLVIDSDRTYLAGLSPINVAVKRAHELHRVEDNVSLLPITETQLRQKFSELDRNNDGYLRADEFANIYSSFQLVSVDPTGKALQTLVKKSATRDGRITFEAFSMLMLRLVNM